LNANTCIYTYYAYYSFISFFFISTVFHYTRRAPVLHVQFVLSTMYERFGCPAPYQYTSWKSQQISRIPFINTLYIKSKFYLLCSKILNSLDLSFEKLTSITWPRIRVILVCSLRDLELLERRQARTLRYNAQHYLFICSRQIGEITRMYFVLKCLTFKCSSSTNPRQLLVCIV
jgi:hypothetical protein